MTTAVKLKAIVEGNIAIVCSQHLTDFSVLDKRAKVAAPEEEGSTPMVSTTAGTASGTNGNSTNAGDHEGDAAANSGVAPEAMNDVS